MTGQIPASVRMPNVIGIIISLKNGGPTVIFTPLTASERIGKRVPQRTANAAPTSRRLLNRKLLLRETNESRRFFLPCWAQRGRRSATDSTDVDPPKPALRGAARG